MAKGAPRAGEGKKSNRQKVEGVQSPGVGGARPESEMRGLHMALAAAVVVLVAAVAVIAVIAVNATAASGAGQSVQHASSSTQPLPRRTLEQRGNVPAAASQDGAVTSAKVADAVVDDSVSPPQRSAQQPRTNWRRSLMPDEHLNDVHITGSLQVDGTTSTAGLTATGSVQASSLTVQTAQVDSLSSDGNISAANDVSSDRVVTNSVLATASVSGGSMHTNILSSLTSDLVVSSPGTLDVSSEGRLTMSSTSGVAIGAGDGLTINTVGSMLASTTGDSTVATTGNQLIQAGGTMEIASTGATSPVFVHANGAVSVASSGSAGGIHMTANAPAGVSIETTSADTTKAISLKATRGGVSVEAGSTVASGYPVTLRGGKGAVDGFSGGEVILEGGVGTTSGLTANDGGNGGGLHFSGGVGGTSQRHGGDGGAINLVAGPGGDALGVGAQGGVGGAVTIAGGEGGSPSATTRRLDEDAEGDASTGAPAARRRLHDGHSMGGAVNVHGGAGDLGGGDVTIAGGQSVNAAAAGRVAISSERAGGDAVTVSAPAGAIGVSASQVHVHGTTAGRFASSTHVNIHSDGTEHEALLLSATGGLTSRSDRAYFHSVGVMQLGAGGVVQLHGDDGVVVDTPERFVVTAEQPSNTAVEVKATTGGMKVTAAMNIAHNAGGAYSARARTVALHSLDTSPTATRVTSNGGVLIDAASNVDVTTNRMTLEAKDSAEGALTLTSVGGTHVETGDGPVIVNGGGSSGFVSLVAQRVLSLASSDTCPEAVTVSSAGGVKVEAATQPISLHAAAAPIDLSTGGKLTLTSSMITQRAVEVQAQGGVELRTIQGTVYLDAGADVEVAAFRNIQLTSSGTNAESLKMHTDGGVQLTAKGVHGVRIGATNAAVQVKASADVSLSAGGNVVVTSRATGATAVDIDSAGGVRITSDSDEDIAIVPCPTGSTGITRGRLDSAMNANGQALDNLGLLNGAPRLGAVLDADGHDLTNVTTISGRQGSDLTLRSKRNGDIVMQPHPGFATQLNVNTRLGAQLDVNNQDLVNVSHVIANAQSSILMDSVTQFNDDVNINNQTMRNTRDIEGAPRLLDALDVNDQDLVNLYMLYGRPTLGVTLDVNRQDLVHVSRVAAHPSDSIIMDSVTQFNDDVNVNGQDMVNVGLIKGAPTMGDTLNMAEQLLDNVAVARGDTLTLSATSTTRDATRLLSDGGIYLSSAHHDVNITAERGKVLLSAWTELELSAGNAMTLTTESGAASSMLLSSSGGIILTSDNQKDILFSPDGTGVTAVHKLQLRTDADIAQWTLNNVAHVTGSDIDVEATGTTGDSLTLRSRGGVSVSAEDRLSIQSRLSDMSVYAAADLDITAGSRVILSAMNGGPDSLTVRSGGAVNINSDNEQHITIEPDPNAFTRVARLQLTTAADMNEQELYNTALVTGSSISVQTSDTAGGLTLTSEGAASLQATTGNVDVASQNGDVSVSAGGSAHLSAQADVIVHAQGTGNGPTAPLQLQSNGGLRVSTGSTASDSIEFVPAGGVLVQTGAGQNIELNPHAAGNTNVARLRLTTDGDINNFDLANARRISSSQTGAALELLSPNHHLSISSAVDTSVYASRTLLLESNTGLIDVSSGTGVRVRTDANADIQLSPGPGGDTRVHDLLLETDADFARYTVNNVNVLDGGSGGVTVSTNNGNIDLTPDVAGGLHTRISKLQLATEGDLNNHQLINAVRVIASADLNVDSPSGSTYITPAVGEVAGISRLRLETDMDANSQRIVNAVSLEAHPLSALTLTATSGDVLAHSSAGRVELSAGESCPDAVNVVAPNGGIIVSAADDVQLRTSGGDTVVDKLLLATNANFGHYTVNDAATFNGEDLAINAFQGAGGGAGTLTLSSETAMVLTAGSSARVYAPVISAIATSDMLLSTAGAASVVGAAELELQSNGDVSVLSNGGIDVSAVQAVTVTGNGVSVIPHAGNTYVEQLQLGTNMDANGHSIVDPSSITTSTTLSVTATLGMTLSSASGPVSVHAGDGLTLTGASGIDISSSNDVDVVGDDITLRPAGSGYTYIRRGRLESDLRLESYNLIDAADVVASSNLRLLADSGNVDLSAGSSHNTRVWRGQLQTDLDANFRSIVNAPRVETPGGLTLTSTENVASLSGYSGVSISSTHAATGGDVTVSSVGRIDASAVSHIDLQPGSTSQTRVHRLALQTDATFNSNDISDVAGLTGSAISVDASGPLTLTGNTATLAATSSLSISSANGPVSVTSAGSLDAIAATSSQFVVTTVHGTSGILMTPSDAVHTKTRVTATASTSDALVLASDGGVSVTSSDADIRLAPGGTGVTRVDDLSLATDAYLNTRTLHGAGSIVSTSTITVSTTADASVRANSDVVLSAGSSLTASASGDVRLSAGDALTLQGTDYVSIFADGTNPVAVNNLRLATDMNANGFDLENVNTIRSSSGGDLQLTALSSDIQLRPTGAGQKTRVWGLQLEQDANVATRSLLNAALVQAAVDLTLSTTSGGDLWETVSGRAHTVASGACPDAVMLHADNGGIQLTAADHIIVNPAASKDTRVSRLWLASDADFQNRDVSNVAQLQGTAIHVDATSSAAGALQVTSAGGLSLSSGTGSVAITAAGAGGLGVSSAASIDMVSATTTTMSSGGTTSVVGAALRMDATGAAASAVQVTSSGGVDVFSALDIDLVPGGNLRATNLHLTNNANVNGKTLYNVEALVGEPGTPVQVVSPDSAVTVLGVGATLHAAGGPATVESDQNVAVTGATGVSVTSGADITLDPAGSTNVDGLRLTSNANLGDYDLFNAATIGSADNTDLTLVGTNSDVVLTPSGRSRVTRLTLQTSADLASQTLTNTRSIIASQDLMMSAPSGQAQLSASTTASVTAAETTIAASSGAASVTAAGSIVLLPGTNLEAHKVKLMTSADVNAQMLTNVATLAGDSVKLTGTTLELESSGDTTIAAATGAVAVSSGNNNVDLSAFQHMLVNAGKDTYIGSGESVTVQAGTTMSLGAATQLAVNVANGPVTMSAASFSLTPSASGSTTIGNLKLSGSSFHANGVAMTNVGSVSGSTITLSSSAASNVRSANTVALSAGATVSAVAPAVTVTASGTISLSSAGALTLTTDATTTVTSLVLDGDADGNGNDLTDMGGITARATLGISAPSGDVTITPSGHTVVSKLKLATAADLATQTLTNAASISAAGVLTLSAPEHISVVATQTVRLTASESCPDAVQLVATAGGVELSAVEDVTLLPGASFSTKATRLELQTAADINSQPLNNLGNLGGAPRLVASLNVNGQDLTNVGVLSGNPELGSNLDGGGNTISNVDINADVLSVATSVNFNNLIDAADIGTGAITTDEILDGTVGTADVQDGSLTGADIENLSVANVDIAPDAIDSSKIALNTIIAADIATDAIGADELAPDAVLTVNIADQQVTTAKIALKAVTTALINDNAVDNDQIADSAVNARTIATNAVNGDELAPNAVSTGHIVNGQVMTEDLADNAVDADKLDETDAYTVVGLTVTTGGLTVNTGASITFNNQLDAADIAPNAVDTSELAPLAVTEAKIASGAVTGAKVSSTAALSVASVTATGIVSAATIQTGTATASGACTAGQLRVNGGDLCYCGSSGWVCFAPSDFATSGHTHPP